MVGDVDILHDHKQGLNGCIGEQWMSVHCDGSFAKDVFAGVRHKIGTSFAVGGSRSKRTAPLTSQSAFIQWLC